MTAWPKRANGTDKLYSELSGEEKDRLGLSGVISYAWNELRALMAERCLELSFWLMPSNTEAKRALATALAEYSSKVHSAKAP